MAEIHLAFMKELETKWLLLNFRLCYGWSMYVFSVGITLKSLAQRSTKGSLCSSKIFPSFSISVVGM